jgi:hypothetical protein
MSKALFLPVYLGSGLARMEIFLAGLPVFLLDSVFISFYNLPNLWQTRL